MSDTDEFVRSDRSSDSSVVYVIGESKSHCGYCGNSDKESSVSYGMHAECLSVYTYQSLLDRGWRRSGKWLYKPVHHKTCCQLITIRLDVRKFEESASQKRVRRRWKSYIEGDASLDKYGIKSFGHEDSYFEGGSPKRPREDDSEVTLIPKMQNAKILNQTKRQRSNVCLTSLDPLHDQESPSFRFSEKLQMESVENIRKQHESDNIVSTISKALNNAVAKLKNMGEIPNIDYPRVMVKGATSKLKKICGNDVVCSSNVALAISGKAKGQGVSVPAEEVADCLLKNLNLDMDSLYVRKIGAHLNVHTRSERLKNSIVGQQEMKGPCGHVQRGAAPKEGHNFRIVTVPSSDSRIPEIEFDLFKRYQTIHHKDDADSVTVESFKRFLCDSPLISVPPDQSAGIPSCGYGSFHQQYWIDEDLVAVGVIDILPKCLSSKYFFWDPSKAKLSLGTLASLFEIDWIQNQSISAPSLQYYYLGYYLHDCHRMRYKASFSPSELLCPTTYNWIDIASISHKLDRGEIPWSFSRPKNRLDDECRNKKADELDTINLMIPYPGSPIKAPFRNGKILKFGALRKMGLLRSTESEEQLKNQIKEWMDMVGPVCENMLFAV